MKEVLELFFEIRTPSTEEEGEGEPIEEEAARRLRDEISSRESKIEKSVVVATV